jgi:hypothetical protein
VSPGGHARPTRPPSSILPRSSLSLSLKHLLLGLDLVALVSLPLSLTHLLLGLDLVALVSLPLSLTHLVLGLDLVALFQRRPRRLGHEHLPRPTHPSESPIRVTHPSHPSESPIQGTNTAPVPVAAVPVASSHATAAGSHALPP